jgi:hypothetical protein
MIPYVRTGQEEHMEDFDRMNHLMENESINDRDRTFVRSLVVSYARWGKLTERQSSALQSIFDRYSEEAINKHNAWIEQYPSLKLEAKIAAEYYAANPPYYFDLAFRILSDDDFIPTERQFNAIARNKYALKVIEATQAEPLYPNGTLVEGRSTAPYTLRDIKAFVMKSGHVPVTSPAKGSKMYLVLPIGSAKPVLIEERHLKLAKKLKKDK